MCNLSLINQPCIVLSDNLKSWFSQKIKQHTKGQYSHAMWWSPRHHAFISQGWRLEAVPPEKYCDEYHRLKFYYNPDLCDDRIENILDNQLKKRQRYDWLGIIGQWLGMKWINFPCRNYCSEAVWEPFVILYSAPQVHPSPSDLDKWLPILGWFVVYVHDPNEKGAY
ncbi:MAG TPA: hypothetical protein PLX83_16990 [bacterium]|nr:hypothetical protein [bacterium]